MRTPGLLKTSCRSSRWLGGLGAIVSCSGMIVAAIAGVTGAAATGAAKGGSMAGMESMSSSSSNPAWVNGINTVGQPLLIVSLVLIILGLLPRGWVPTMLAVIGSVLFYSFMFIHYDVPLAVVAAVVLGAAYGVAFWPRHWAPIPAGRRPGEPLNL